MADFVPVANEAVTVHTPEPYEADESLLALGSQIALGVAAFFSALGLSGWPRVAVPLLALAAAYGVATRFSGRANAQRRARRISVLIARRGIKAQVAPAALTFLIEPPEESGVLPDVTMHRELFATLAGLRMEEGVDYVDDVLWVPLEGTPVGKAEANFERWWAAARALAEFEDPPSVWHMACALGETKETDALVDSLRALMAREPLPDVLEGFIAALDTRLDAGGRLRAATILGLPDRVDTLLDGNAELADESIADAVRAIWAIDGGEARLERWLGHERPAVRKASCVLPDVPVRLLAALLDDADGDVSAMASDRVMARLEAGDRVDLARFVLDRSPAERAEWADDVDRQPALRQALEVIGEHGDRTDRPLVRGWRGPRTTQGHAAAALERLDTRLPPSPGGAMSVVEPAAELGALSTLEAKRLTAAEGVGGLAVAGQTEHE